jgi:hypothetical protein
MPPHLILSSEMGFYELHYSSWPGMAIIPISSLLHSWDGRHKPQSPDQLFVLKDSLLLLSRAQALEYYRKQLTAHSSARSIV